MYRWKKWSVSLVAAACLFCALLPVRAVADAGPARADTPLFKAVVVLSGSGSSKHSRNESLTAQISDTYRAAKKKAHVKSFKGKCGKYVNQQLVALGINTKYIGCNGNREYDVYCKKSVSSGGYRIHAYSAKKYSLKEALHAIQAEDPNARNILVGFQKGTSKAGKKYGHTLLIHGIENGMVYFSDSFAQTVNGVRYKEGAPIVCPIDTFAKLYQKYKLDGVIWFE